MLVFDIQQSESAIRTLISPVCHHRALSRVPSAIQKVLISYLFYKQQCIYVNPNQKVKHKYHIFTYLCESRKIVCANSMCLTLCDPMDCSPPGFSVHRDSPGKNTGVGCQALLQGIFPTQGLNPGLSRCRWILYCLSHQGRHLGSPKQQQMAWGISRAFIYGFIL